MLRVDIRTRVALSRRLSLSEKFVWRSVVFYYYTNQVGANTSVSNMMSYSKMSKMPTEVPLCSLQITSSPL
jgi:hypothetical protein